MSEEAHIKANIRSALLEKGYPLTDGNISAVYYAHLGDSQDKPIPKLIESISYQLTK